MSFSAFARLCKLCSERNRLLSSEDMRTRTPSVPFGIRSLLSFFIRLEEEGMAASSLICSETISRVSSVLNREVKQFGKKYMFDGNEETSWNSDQGATQWLTVEFPQTVQASQIQIQFQGGFASRKCLLQGGQKGGDLSTIAEFYPEDNNSLQSFPFEGEPLDKLKITFQNSSDFFGRIVVYHLDILGQKL